MVAGAVTGCGKKEAATTSAAVEVTTEAAKEETTEEAATEAATEEETEAEAEVSLNSDYATWTGKEWEDQYTDEIVESMVSVLALGFSEDSTLNLDTLIDMTVESTVQQ